MQIHETKFLSGKNFLTVDEDELKGIGLDMAEIVRCIRQRRMYPAGVTVKAALPIDTALRISADGGIVFKTMGAPEPKRIYVSEDKKVTVVIWNDGDKTIVRCSDGDEPDVEKGIWAAAMKKLYGPRSRYKKLFGDVVFQGE